MSEQRRVGALPERGADLAQLMAPIDTSVSGIPKLIAAYCSGTPEMQQLLGSECDVILECKECRSMYRSVANFVAHKRSYCPAASPLRRMQHGNRRPQVLTDFTTLHSINNELTRRGLSNIVDRLSLRAATAACSPGSPPPSTASPCSGGRAGVQGSNPEATAQREYYTAVAEAVKERRAATRELVVALTPLSASHLAVSQLLAAGKGSVASGSCSQPPSTPNSPPRVQSHPTSPQQQQQKRVSPPDSLQSLQVKRSRGRPRKISVDQVSSPSPGLAPPAPKVRRFLDTADVHEVKYEAGEPLPANYCCEKCRAQFTSQKGLSLHESTQHMTTRMQYTCPSCKSSFCNLWSTYRHLKQVHNKSQEQVDKLKPMIRKRAFKMNIPVIRGGSTNGSSSSASPASSASTSPAHRAAPHVSPEQPSSKKRTLASSITSIMHNNNREEFAPAEWGDSGANFTVDVGDHRCGICALSFERRAALVSHTNTCHRNTKPAQHKPSQVSAASRGGGDSRGASPVTSPLRERSRKSRAPARLTRQAVVSTPELGSEPPDSPPPPVLEKSPSREDHSPSPAPPEAKLGNGPLRVPHSPKCPTLSPHRPAKSPVLPPRAKGSNPPTLTPAAVPKKNPVRINPEESLKNSTKNPGEVQKSPTQVQISPGNVPKTNKIQIRPAETQKKSSSTEMRDIPPKSAKLSPTESQQKAPEAEKSPVKLGEAPRSPVRSRAGEPRTLPNIIKRNSLIASLARKMSSSLESASHREAACEVKQEPGNPAAEVNGDKVVEAAEQASPKPVRVTQRKVVEVRGKLGKDGVFKVKSKKVQIIPVKKPKVAPVQPKVPSAVSKEPPVPSKESRVVATQGKGVNIPSTPVTSKEGQESGSSGVTKEVRLAPQGVSGTPQGAPPGVVRGVVPKDSAGARVEQEVVLKQPRAEILVRTSSVDAREQRSPQGLPVGRKGTVVAESTQQEGGSGCSDVVQVVKHASPSPLVSPLSAPRSWLGQVPPGPGTPPLAPQQGGEGGQARSVIQVRRDYAKPPATLQQPLAAVQPPPSSSSVPQTHVASAAAAPESESETSCDLFSESEDDGTIAPGFRGWTERGAARGLQQRLGLPLASHAMLEDSSAESSATPTESEESETSMIEISDYEEQEQVVKQEDLLDQMVILQDQDIEVQEEVIMEC